MVYNINLVTNSTTLSYFEHLQENNLKPQLALYNNKTLMITSYKSDHLFEKTYLLYLKIKCFVLNHFGFLDSDRQKIRAIKKQVELYHFDKCRHLRQKNDRLKQSEIDDLKISNKKIQDEIHSSGLLESTKNMLGRINEFNKRGTTI